MLLSDLTDSLLPSAAGVASRRKRDTAAEVSAERKLRIRSFLLGIFLAIIIALIAIFSAISMVVIHKHEDDDLAEDESTEEELLKHAEYIILSSLASLGYVLHFLVCISWISILLALMIFGTPLADAKSSNFTKAVIFLGGLFYGMVSICMLIQTYFFQEYDTFASFWMEVLVDFVHQGILLAAMYDTFRVRKENRNREEDDDEEEGRNYNNYTAAMIV